MGVTPVHPMDDIINSRQSTDLYDCCVVILSFSSLF